MTVHDTKTKTMTDRRPLKAWIRISVSLLLVSLAWACSGRVSYNLPARKYRRVYTGLENFISNHAKSYRGRKAVLVTNQSGVDYQLQKNIDLLRKKGIEICFILAPEHGIYGYENEYDRSMYHSDEVLNAVIYNLHHLDNGKLGHLLKIADTVIFDIQDMGLRCYTYISALKTVMDSLNGRSTELIVLDRPNPLGFLGIDGPYLERAFQSRHVSAFPSPFMYGMTLGEAARYYRGEFAGQVRLKVIPLVNYGRDMLYNETMLPWVPPSPNLPTYESSVVYASIVMLEGVAISVGRGTPKPFEYIGAPWIEPVSFSRGLGSLGIGSFKFRPIYFSPTFSKYRGVRCGGVQLFYVGGRFSPIEVSYRILGYIKENYTEFRWETFRGAYSIDYLAGSDSLRRAIDAKKPYPEFAREVRKGNARFIKKRAGYLMY
jgi:uncharacterized protein YbbC (DUF1343 family)